MARLATLSRPLNSRAIAASSRMATLGDVVESAAKFAVVNVRQISSRSAMTVAERAPSSRMASLPKMVPGANVAKPILEFANCRYAAGGPFRDDQHLPRSLSRKIIAPTG
jgi:hypothetical protein